jgi:hypothetical protein
MSTRRLAMRATGGFAVAGAIALVASLGVPVLLDRFGTVLLGTGFLVAALGIVYLTVLRVAFGPNVGWPRTAVPPWNLLSVLFAASLMAVVVGGLGLMRTDGFSADSAPLRSCPWTLSTDHGSRVVCVSHDRWLMVNESVAMGLLGFLVFVCAIVCALFATNWALTSAAGPGLPTEHERPLIHERP